MLGTVELEEVVTLTKRAFRMVSDLLLLAQAKSEEARQLDAISMQLAEAVTGLVVLKRNVEQRQARDI